MEELKNYLEKEFNRSVHKKYRHLFEQWFEKMLLKTIKSLDNGNH